MYIPLSLIIIAIVCYFLFFGNRQSQSEITPNNKNKSMSQNPNDMYQRGEMAINELEKMYNVEKAPEDIAQNKVRIKNWNRVLERIKHDNIKLKQVVEDLEVCVKDFRKFSKYRFDTYSDDPSYLKESEVALIRSEEILTRFKEILGDQYQDPWEEYMRVRKEGMKK